MSQDEGNSLGGRLGRYARVGSSVGGLAVKLAGQRYLGWSLDRDKHATELRSALGGLKGPLMKVGRDSLHHSRSPAAGICARPATAAIQRPADGLAVRAAADEIRTGPTGN